MSSGNPGQFQRGRLLARGPSANGLLFNQLSTQARTHGSQEKLFPTVLCQSRDQCYGGRRRIRSRQFRVGFTPATPGRVRRSETAIKVIAIKDLRSEKVHSGTPAGVSGVQFRYTQRQNDIRTAVPGTVIIETGIGGCAGRGGCSSNPGQTGRIPHTPSRQHVISPARSRRSPCRSSLTRTCWRTPGATTPRRAPKASPVGSQQFRPVDLLVLLTAQLADGSVRPLGEQEERSPFLTRKPVPVSTLRAFFAFPSGAVALHSRLPVFRSTARIARAVEAVDRAVSRRTASC